MESITAFVACSAAFALSYYFGYGRAPSTLVALVLGAVSGVGFAVIFFAMTVGSAILLPGIFDGRTLGVHFVGLLAVAPLGAAAIGALAHRYAMTRTSF
jgi:hypothetical protein